MSIIGNDNGSLKITISSHGNSQMIPKQIELLNAKCKSMRSLWVDEDQAYIPDIEPGTYIVRLNLISGIKQDEVVQIDPGEEKQVTIDISDYSPRESQEWAYFSKSRQPFDKQMPLTIKSNLSPYQVSCSLWTLSNQRWDARPLPGMENIYISGDGETFQFHVNENMHLLQLTGENIPSRFICLPPSKELHCLIKPAEGPTEVVYPIDVIVSTDNWQSEALLHLLTLGAMEEAKTLTNVKQAEGLLYDKIIDPTAAAVGGYFLLRVGDLSRLHNWANNLANWFPWMPDGAIIHAWQLLKDKDNVKQNISTIRQRLIEAVKRGIPIYTDGLRLLCDGLTMLSYHYDKRDNVVERALSIIEEYTAAVDWSQETTTFNASSLEAHDLTSERSGTEGMSLTAYSNYSGSYVSSTNH